MSKYNSLTWASGVQCPMIKPWDPPENRPSVISATSLPRPAPMIALVGVSISGMPGPPLGPSYLITTTIPTCMNRPNISQTSLEGALCSW